jgi:shikimate dehydrogenase
MTDRYAVFGNPIAHSRSPGIHRLFAEQTGEDLIYDRREVALDGFEEAVRQFFAAGGKGINITVPFKEQAYRLSARLDTAASRAGAVNTLRLDTDGQLCGHNTDGSGLLRDLEHNLGFAIQGTRVLLIGAGGAARGVLHPLLGREPALLTLTNRTLTRAEALVALARDVATSVSIEARALVACAQGHYDLVINATSAGLADSHPALPDGVFGDHAALAYDMVYGSEPTAFERWALASGAQRSSNGLGMLVEQAADAFRIWRGKRPDTAPVIAALRR